MHIRDYSFENMGLEHNPGLDAGELMRSWYADERRDFLSWVSRRGPPPLAHAAQRGNRRGHGVEDLAQDGEAEESPTDTDPLSGGSASTVSRGAAACWSIWACQASF